MNLQMSVQGLDALQRGMLAAPDMVRRELLGTMTALTMHLEGEVADALPAVSGLTRASIVSDAWSTPTGALGVVGSASIAALVLEQGRKPGKGVSKEGQEALAVWAQEKLGVTKVEGLGIAHALSFKYKLHGLPAKKPFEKTLAAQRGQIEQMFETCAQRIAAKLGSAA